MALPPPPPPGGGGSSGGGGGGAPSPSSGGKKKKPRKVQSVPSSDPQHNPWVVFEDGHIKFVSAVNPPKNALTSFGLPIKRSDFLQAQSHYNDLFRSWIGRGVKSSELAHILTRGTSDFALQLHFTRLKGFKKSAVYKSYQAQASRIIGGHYKPNAREIRQALKNGGDLTSALAHSDRALKATAKHSRDEVQNILGGAYTLNRRQAKHLLEGESLQSVLVHSKGARQAATNAFTASQGGQLQYLAGAFGPGRLDQKQLQALALQNAGLRQSPLATRLQAALESALQKYQHVFSGNLATPSLTLGGGGLQAPSLLGQNQEPDVAA